MTWDPFEEIENMHKDMDRLFNRMFRQETPLLEHGKIRNDMITWNERFRIPLSDLKQTESEIISTIELPGADKKDIELNVTKDFIEVKVDKKNDKKVETNDAYSFMQSRISFYRRIPLPVEVQTDKAKASYNNGVLRIEIPKSRQLQNNSKRIAID
jgi:HSP20 family protein